MCITARPVPGRTRDGEIDMTQMQAGRSHWAARAWDQGGVEDGPDHAGRLAGAAIDAGLSHDGLSSFDAAPELDVLGGMGGLLDSVAMSAAEWHDLTGADEPDWTLQLGFEPLEHFEGFDGFDETLPAGRGVRLVSGGVHGPLTQAAD